MRAIVISAALLLVPVLVSCGSGAGSDPDGAPVVATTGVLADIAGEVAGPRVDVAQLIPDGSSPHDFQLSAQDRQTLEEADLLVATGAGLEAGIPLDELDTPRWLLTDHVGELLPFEEAGAHEREHAAVQGEDTAAQGEQAGDPHVWMDPTRVARALPSLADALADIGPAGAAGYRERARAYAERLRRLDRELKVTLARVPRANRELITSHDSLGYFADRYGFEVIATAFPASGPEAEVSAALIDEVERAVGEHEVPAVFAQREDDPETLRLIAEETGVEIEEGLLMESPAGPGSYEEMLRLDARLIAQALR